MLGRRREQVQFEVDYPDEQGNTCHSERVPTMCLSVAYIKARLL